MCSVCGGRRAAGASPIRCVGERITATGVPEFREVAWRAWAIKTSFIVTSINSITLGKYCLNKPLAFSFCPLSQEL
ncbi:hypothetical protein [Bathymodiolus japonicus methanotrophic gill symbiont]|uniref:hypothetical protein n=1 Tax=Bathymodiolus japonicus methanotrophic gill symbiont TaxID=113269 RepID=UPI001E5A9E49|nr:hypothetical protein [Bathymodiolus japonicus methanotrophic gill symbiont]